MELQKLNAEIEALNSKLEAEKTNPGESRLAELQAAAEAEEKRLNSKAYKDALKTIDALEEKAAAKQAEAHKAIDDFLAEMDEWEAITNEHKRLAKQHRIEAQDLYKAASTKTTNIFNLKKSVAAWKENKSVYSRLKTIGL